ncbi:MAG: hypothetical protein AWL62_2215, partial [Halanaerobium sp. T82-1]
MVKVKSLERDKDLENVELPEEVEELLAACPKYIVAHNEQQLEDLSVRDAKNGCQEVKYDIPGRGEVVEAVVCKVRNGISANYPEPYMRRRDPNCMLIADEKATDKEKYENRFGEKFEDGMRAETFAWLKKQELALFFFETGPKGLGVKALAVVPANAAFFAFGLSLLQGIVDTRKLEEVFKPTSHIYIA